MYANENEVTGLQKCKADIRKCILDKRAELPAEIVQEKSSLILKGLNLLESYRKSEVVMCYMDFRNEVMTSGIIENCLELGKKVVIPCPVVMPDGQNGLRIYEIKDLSCDVCAGKYGILEPNREKLAEIEPGTIDIVLVPGVVFDINRFRIGYGAGYYDRFLKTVRSDCFKAGLAFDVQVVDDVPVDSHDMQMDVIITESRIIY